MQTFHSVLSYSALHILLISLCSYPIVYIVIVLVDTICYFKWPIYTGNKGCLVFTITIYWSNFEREKFICLEKFEGKSDTIPAQCNNLFKICLWFLTKIKAGSPDKLALLINHMSPEAYDHWNFSHTLLEVVVTNRKMK